VVIITGNGHARTDWGVPALLAVAAPDVTVFALGQFEAEPVSQVPFDAWRSPIRSIGPIPARRSVDWTGRAGQAISWR
jgi:hypothetical protein